MKANREGSIAVIQKIARLNDKQIAGRSYKILKDDLVVDPRIPPEVINKASSSQAEPVPG